MIIVLKKNQEFNYDESKIAHAITQAYNQICYPDFSKINRMVEEITDSVALAAVDGKIDVKQIENIVMSMLYKDAPEVAREYSRYKMDKERATKSPTEVEKVLYVSPEIEHENGNKNPHLVHIKNAYLAEIPSKEMMRKLLPKDCLEANDRGVVKFHDMSYSARDMFNCCNWNLEEMFKGCNINGIYIETPKSFRTACTVASQALSHATSSQYGLK